RFDEQDKRQTASNHDERQELPVHT
ncbi:MAG: hypothetical protein RLZZ55_1296, partial [Bacteroidota bacterium]